MTTVHHRADGPDLVAVWLGISLSGVLLGLSLFMAAGASQMRVLSATGPGSGFLPLIVGLVLAVVSAIYLVQRILDLRGAVATPTVDAAQAALSAVGETPAEQHSAERPEAGIGRAAVVVASLCALAALLEYVGFQVSMFLFLLFHLKVLGRQRWVTTLVVAAIGSFGVYALFSGLLRVTLPHSDIPLLESWGL